jgi:putative membrane protein
MFPVRAFVGLVLMTSAGAALAHGGQEHHQGPAWTFDPWVTVPLAAALLLFLIGRRRLARRSGVHRGRSWLFVGGWLALALALISPLHEGGERSFTLHMAEHELIMLVATLLLAASHTGGILVWGMPAGLRRTIGGTWKSPLASTWRHLTDPLTATILQAVVMWAWHAPALFNRALASDGWHVAQHLSFFISSLIFWAAMVDPRRGGYLLSAACLFLTSLVEGALGGLMALSSSPWYSAYAAMGMTGIGMDPLTDQRLAGLLMWIPGGVVHGSAALVLLHAWLTNQDSGQAISTR